jgi:2-polyprenyl-6-methoxyphenol hydroxylase-like FAD-dependent oxidoreductase
MMETTVLIAGAGPTGLALACDLARRGVSFRIVDKAEKYFAGSRGKGLQPRSLEALDDFGVIEEVLASGRFHLPFRGYDGAKVVGDRDLHEGRNPTPDVPYASPLIIPQWRVEEILRNRLAEWSGQVELATELTAFEQDHDGVTATLAHSGETEQVRVRFLVGADGGRSFVRHALGVGFEGETWASERMLVGDVRVDSLDRDHWHSWPHPTLGWVALCPLPGTESFQFQAQIGPEEPDEPSLERFQQIIDERTGGMGLRLYDATWLSLYRANVRMVDRYRVGRVFLAGDAAHVHSPAGGQGMNTGIQDSYNLGWKLACALNGAPDALLDTYEEERLPVAAWMLGVTSKLHRNALLSDAKDNRRGPETLQLGIAYRDGKLAREERKAPGNVRAGDRAPNAPCHDAAGNSVRLFDIFRGPHFTLLAFDPPDGHDLSEIAQPYGSAVRTRAIMHPGATCEGEAIVDTDGHAHRAYDVQSGVSVLVRPDGYIALIAEDVTPERVHQHLRFAFDRAAVS